MIMVINLNKKFRILEIGKNVKTCYIMFTCIIEFYCGQVGCYYKQLHLKQVIYL